MKADGQVRAPAMWDTLFQFSDAKRKGKTIKIRVGVLRQRTNNGWSERMLSRSGRRGVSKIHDRDGNEETNLIREGQAGDAATPKEIEKTRCCSEASHSDIV